MAGAGLCFPALATKTTSQKLSSGVVLKTAAFSGLFAEFFELDGAAFPGGGAGGVEDLHHHDVGVEGAQVALIFDAAAEHRSEVVEGIALVCCEMRRGGELLLVVVLVAQAKLVGSDGDGIASGAIDFHIFAAEGPVPRGP